MRNIKLSGIIVLAVVLGFAFTVCQSDDNGTPELQGTITITTSTSFTVGEELTAVYSGGTETITEWQWKKDNVSVGTNSSKFTPTAAGIYTVACCADGYKNKVSPAVTVTVASESPSNHPLDAVMPNVAANCTVNKPLSTGVNPVSTSTAYKIIFFGDSNTQAWPNNWASIQSSVGGALLGRGVGGEGIQHVLYRVKNGEFPAGVQAEYIVLMIGTNNNGGLDFNGLDSISWNKKTFGEWMAAGIGEILKHINTTSPSTQMFLLSVPPQDQWGNPGSGEYDNQVMYAFCNEILQTYDGISNVHYIDSHTALTTDTIESYNGWEGSVTFRRANSSYFADALHLNAAGYEVLNGLIAAKINEIEGK